MTETSVFLADLISQIKYMVLYLYVVKLLVLKYSIIKVAVITLAEKLLNSLALSKEKRMTTIFELDRFIVHYKCALAAITQCKHVY
jgi:hypothetical protein